MQYRFHGLALIRSKCLFEDCDNRQRFKGYNFRGQKMWDKYCNKHHRLRYGLLKKDKEFFQKNNGGISNTKCELCDWDKVPCDRHRKIPSKGYVKGNVTILCPNCHRLQSLGLI